MSKDSLAVIEASANYLPLADAQDVPPGYKRTDVGVIPEDWAVKRLSELFEITSSKRVFQSEWKTEGIPFYRARELAVLGEKGYVQNELFISKEMYEAYKNIYGVPKLGDMLVTGVGTLGKAYVVSDDHEFYFKDGNIIWFKISGKVKSEFLRQLYLTQLIAKQIEDASAGTTVGTYTISSAKKTTIPFPTLAEQGAIAKALSDVDGLIASLDKLISKKRAIKQAAMQQLLTGKTHLPGFSGEWEKKRISDVAPLQRGFDLPTSRVQSGPYPVVYSNGVLNYHKHAMVKAPGVVTGRSGTIGKVHYVEEDFWPHNTSLWVTSFRGNEPKFIFYLYSFLDFARFLSGSGVPTLNRNDVHQHLVLCPRPEEQKAIVTVISEIDAEIAMLEHRQDKIRAIKQGMMQQLLTGRVRLVKPKNNVKAEAMA